MLLHFFLRPGEIAFGSRGGGEKIELNGGMFYIPNRYMVRQLKKVVFFHQTSGTTTKFWQRYRNKSLQQNKKVQNQRLSSLPLKYACQPLSKMLHWLAKNGHASRARASAVFRFLPSPFTSMPYFLIDKRLQVKAKTIFAFTPCDLHFLTRRGREIPNENAEKEWTFDQNVPTFVPKPTTIQATPAQR